ncbi:hypothetical protein [Helicobacter sp. L8]|uniref:hypothetical protein n=1 Tax=Helicobacter sp. L8 TaxID=2316078 RepID=UPI000EB243EA|nr:hypothetical protein [Helicobacter sp. L8]
MQAPDISAGRGGLAAMSDALAQMRASHQHLANTFAQIHDRLDKSSNKLLSLAAQKELQDYKQKRDAIEDARANRLATLQENQLEQQALQTQKNNAFRNRQFEEGLKQQAISNQFKKQELANQTRTSKAQAGLLGAQTRGQNIQAYEKGALLRTSSNPQDIQAGINAQVPLAKAKAPNKPPLVNPNYSRPLTRP